jgi:hypothetical protein
MKGGSLYLNNRKLREKVDMPLREYVQIGLSGGSIGTKVHVFRSNLHRTVEKLQRGGEAGASSASRRPKGWVG